MTHPSRRMVISPIVVGFIAAALSAVLIFIGIVRGNVPTDPQSLFIAFLVGSGSWGLIAWAITQAAVDVEMDGVSVDSEDIEPGQ